MTFNFNEYNQEDFSATYSPEDNKLRLYTDARINTEDWALMKENGFKWAPKQELFVCYWSVAREDFMLRLAGDIMPEEMTIVERAEAKADRLLLLAQKRSDQCVGYQLAANNLMKRLDNNQPILSGHHSQRKAEKTQLQVERNIEKAEETASAVGYWVWRAKGVIGNANYKNNSRTIYNRIKTLLKELRDRQKRINEAAHNLDLIDRIDALTDTEKRNKNIEWLSGDIFFYYNMKDKKELPINEKLSFMREVCEATINSRNLARLIGHTLNRLAYEQGQLSLVSVFDGELTPAVIQTFMRTHGADKPKAIKGDADSWIVESAVCLPLHIGSGLTLELDDQEWRDLMQSVGYEVPAKKTVISILNFKTDLPLQHAKLYDRGNEHLEQKEMTKEEYKQVHSDRRYTRKSACNTFRFKTVNLVNAGGRGHWDTTEFAVFISDSKVHATPNSMQTIEA